MGALASGSERRRCLLCLNFLGIQFTHSIVIYQKAKAACNNCRLQLVHVRGQADQG